MGRGEEDRRRRFESLRDFDRALAPEAWAAEALAGVDEAGVGPLAGPVVAAAVVLPRSFDLPEVFDSKRMTAAQRQRCAGLIRDRAVAFGLAAIAPPRIDRIDILRATLAAHRRALGALGARPQVVFVDGRYTPPAPPGWDDVRFESLIGGDGRSLAVAAASILAKVARDRAMVRLDRRYPEYGFARHKGYATTEHRAALRRHGLSPQHRRSFCGWLEAEAAAARQGTLTFAQPS